jgi:RNA polymerase sigma factor (sigma-70 family)
MAGGPPDGRGTTADVALASWAHRSEAFASCSETDELWIQLRLALLPVVRRKLPAQPQDVEDIVAETFLDMIEARARGRYDPARGTVLALASAIAERRCLDRLRRQYRARAVTTSLDAIAEAGHDGRGPGVEPADPGPDTEAQVVRAEMTRARRIAFAEALHELRGEDERLCSLRALTIALRYRFAIEDDDFRFLFDPRQVDAQLPSWRDVGRQLGLSEEAARQSGSRGLRALRRLVELRPSGAFER